jgi:DNA repair protein RecO (recombination protein O)
VQSRARTARTEALLVRSAPFGDADLMVTLFTEGRGVVSAVARSARRSVKRFAALEPMHLLRVGMDERPGVDLATLTESVIARPRLGLVGSLDKLDAAGAALRWVRRAAPPHTPEPALWLEINGLLDRLDAADPALPAQALLAAAGLRILVAIGWGLELTRCVRCGRDCEPGASACVDPAEGGLVCRACGGARIVLRGERRTLLLAASLGEDVALAPEDTRAALEIVDAAMAAHT